MCFSCCPVNRAQARQFWGSVSLRVEEKRHKELFDFASKALFCGLEVWQDFIRVAVLVLLSLGTNLVTKPYRKFTVQQL